MRLSDFIVEKTEVILDEWEAFARTAEPAASVMGIEDLRNFAAAMLAHELRNPLSPIDAASELLQSGKLNDTQIRNTSEIIGRQVSHMASLINDLLDVSRFTHNMITLQLTELDLSEVINSAVEQTRPLMASRRHKLKNY